MPTTLFIDFLDSSKIDEGEKMTEERKQELAELLDEAMGSLQVRYEHGQGMIYGYELALPIDEYRKYLQERWTVYSVEPAWFFFNVRPYIVSESIKSRLLNFLRDELAPFIEENSMYSVSCAIEGNHSDGFRLKAVRGGVLMLDGCLNHVLKIAVVCGVEEAVSIFDRFSCIKGSHGYFRHVAALEGIRLEVDIKVCKGVRLITVPDPGSGSVPAGLLRHMPSFLRIEEDRYSARGKTLLIIDRPAFSIFYKGSQESLGDGDPIDDLPYQFDLDDEKFTNSEAIRSFEALFCQALSLACNSAVQISGTGWLLAEGKFFHPGNGGVRLSRSPGPFGGSIEVGEAEINEAKCLYKILDKKPDVKEKLRIPIDRWRQSKVGREPVDKMIDLGIALEALYVPERGGDLTYKFSIRAARHLGKNQKCREELLEKFKQIYNCRSDAVHSGKLDKPRKFGKESIPVSDFIDRAQDLCRKSIKKILEDGYIPDWDSLLLGGEGEQASS